MKIQISNSAKQMGEKAAMDAAFKIKEALRERGSVNIILATGASQFETLNHLVKHDHVDWSKVVMFHLDEYAGMPDTHPASFRKYLKERFLDKVAPLRKVHFVEGDRADLKGECRRLSEIILKHPIDVALVGIGENGHLAFNDPPADFDTEDPYLIVTLDEACRKQQMGEGWFKTLEDVPEKAISMSVKQILKSKSIICSVPDKRKAQALRDCINGEISNMHPASILQTHPDCAFYLDTASASLL